MKPVDETDDFRSDIVRMPESLISFQVLPGNWVWTELENIVSNPKNDIVDGPFGSNLKASEYVEDGVPIIRLQNIDRNKFIDKNIRFVSSEKANQLKRHSFSASDIVLTKLGDPLGKACIVPKDFGPGVIVADVVRIRSNEEYISKNYLAYAINSEAVIKQFDTKTKGTTRPRVNLAHIRKLRIPISPLPEQHRIVAKIEELFSRLDAGVEALQKAKAQLRRYRQAVLKAAVEGRLTEEWRKAHPEVEPAEKLFQKIGKLGFKGIGEQEPSTLVSSAWDLSNIPETWILSNIGTASEVIMGQSPPGDSYNQEGVGVPLINGPVEFGPTPFSKTLKTKFTTKPKKMCKENDLILCVRGSTTGRMNISGFDGCVGRGVAALRSFFNQQYLNFYIHSVQHQIFELGIGSTFPNIGIDLIKSLPFPLPPLEEQSEIVEGIEHLFNAAEGTEKGIERNLREAKNLHQSILKRAFEGKLVPQDPSDEPASALLERIRAERAKKMPGLRNHSRGRRTKDVKQSQFS